MARVAGTLTGTAFARGAKTAWGLILGPQAGPDPTAAPTANTLVADPGTVAITGAAAAFTVSLSVRLSPATVAITGDPVTLTTGRVLTLDASTSAFTITGKAATLSLLTSGNFDLQADPGPISISGSPATLVATRGALGRVNIAFDDGPLVAAPTWTRLDDNNVFPEGFVAGYDIHVGRQTLISQTDTGTATVYINDRSGLLDDRNNSSPYQGKLSGRQILLQLYNPVTATWEEQFRGLIEDYRYDIDGSAVDASGDPINASIQIECVDVFDYLNGYGLTPGLDGVTPPAGSEDTVYYAATSGTVDDRIIEILADVGIDPSMYIVASGNVKVLEAKYDPDESALTALRDAADAELPWIANIYVNRHGHFCFRGRYSRFAPDSVAAEPGSEWDFTRWNVGDGKAIQSDPTRAQMRVLSYSRDRGELINAAICYPQGLAATDMPNQVYANTPSITAYGRHSAPPMSELLTADYAGPGTINPPDGKTQCAMYAELLVRNKKDPRLNITALQLKSIDTSDARASVTWELITKADISHIVNVAAGYPGGTGFTGGSTQDDYYIEGRALQVRPANTSYDYVELDLEVSPYLWSADTHSVFPPFGS